MDQNGEIILYEDQDINLWNNELIEKGEYYLKLSTLEKPPLSKYHVEAAIAYWHTQKNDTVEKWSTILQLYNRLLQIEYSPIAALNRTFALAKARGKEEAIAEAEKLNLRGNHLYHSLMGNLYSDLDNKKAVYHFHLALNTAKSFAEKAVITKNINRLNGVVSGS
jgi:RNA polymerase sigma-70 factor (ECF subfamily)